MVLSFFSHLGRSTQQVGVTSHGLLYHTYKSADYTAYLTNETMSGLIAQQQNGATVLLEHRFFGQSNPYPDLSSKSLALLTIQQAIDDLVYFAQNATLPMPGGDKVKPDSTPWILFGGSYSGT